MLEEPLEDFFHNIFIQQTIDIKEEFEIKKAEQKAKGTKKYGST